jgi:hypothetical protein
LAADGKAAGFFAADDAEERRFSAEKISILPAESAFLRVYLRRLPSVAILIRSFKKFYPGAAT